MNAINLSEEQVRLRDQLQLLRDTFSHTPGQAALKKMGKIAAALHQSLHESGTPPRHHAYMTRNRDCEPGSDKFYEHPHPVEDLIKFTEDQTANDDPEDVTLDHEFVVQVYSNRWKHEDSLKLRRTKTGWSISFMEGDIDCDRTGHPALFDHFKHESIEYPRTIGDRLEWLWAKAASDGLSPSQVQSSLNEIFGWVSATEKAAPSGPVWSGF